MLSIYQVQDWQHFDLNTIQEPSLSCLRMRVSEQASQIGQLRDCQKDSRSVCRVHHTFPSIQLWFWRSGPEQERSGPNQRGAPCQQVLLCASHVAGENVAWSGLKLLFVFPHARHETSRLPWALIGSLIDSLRICNQSWNGGSYAACAAPENAAVWANCVNRDSATWVA